MLFSVADYKTRFGITGTAQDERIYAMSVAVTAAANRFCGRILEYDGTETTEYHDGDETAFLALRRPPIISVTSVHQDSSRAWDSTSLLTEGTDYAVLTSTGILEFLDGTWGCARRSIRVIYRGGYASVPPDLAEAAMVWGFHLDTHKAGVTSETIGAYSATYEQASSGAVPREVKQMLGGFIRPSAGRRM